MSRFFKKVRNKLGLKSFGVKNAFVGEKKFFGVKKMFFLS